MYCHECFHSCACGQSSQYNDASQCKNYIRKDAVVPVEVLNKVQDACEDLRTKVRSLQVENRSLEQSLEDAYREMRDLKIIKQTLEMSSGMKFDI